MPTTTEPGWFAAATEPAAAVDGPSVQIPQPAGSQPDNKPPKPGNDASNGAQSGSHWMTITFSSLGMILLAAGGGSVVIQGLGVSLANGVQSTSAQITCVALGGLALCAAFLVHFGLHATEGRLMLGGTIAVSVLLAGLVLTGSPKVPDITGLSEANAEKILRQLDVEVRGIRSEISEQPSGQVIAQDPVGGERSTDIFLTVSASVPPPKLPDLVGFRLDLAQRLLDDFGISYDVTRVAGQPAGEVVATIPPSGATTSNVLMTVADGVALPSMVDVIGQSRAEAAAAISNAGIEVTVIDAESASPVGTVLSQDPPAGAETSTATITVSAGPGLPVIPDITHRNVEDVRALLADLGIALTTRSENSDVVPEGAIISQDQSAGERATDVAAVVSSGPSAPSFDGDWVNVDDQTGGLLRLSITAEGSAMQGFGACAASACDWGTTPASLENHQLVGRWDFGFKVTELEAEVAGPLLLVTVRNDYAEGDERSDRVDVYTLRVNDRPVLTSNDVDALSDSAILEDIVASGAARHVPELISLAPEIAVSPLAGG